MTLLDAYKTHKGALDLEKILPYRTRKFLRGLSFFSVVSGSVYATLATILGWPFIPQVTGLVFIFGSLYGVFWLLGAYFNTYYFYGLNSSIGLDDRKVTGCSFEVSEVIAVNPDDLIDAFVNSRIGREVLLRAGIKPNLLDQFLAEKRAPVSAQSIEIEADLIIRIERLALLLLQRDHDFEDFLAHQQVFEEQFMDSARWVADRFRVSKRRERWWSKDNLSKTSSLGREWSFGQTHLLQQFAKDIRTSAVFSTLSGNSAYAKEKVEEIESTLARDVSANVLLVGEAGVGKIDLLIEVSRRMDLGEAVSSITGQHMTVLDTAKIFTLHDTKQDIENLILNLFHEAESAGNVIIVIENISTFIKEARTIDIHIPEILDRFLSSNELHVIVTDTPGAYHNSLEPLHGFTRRFQEVLIDTPSLESTVRVLSSVADKHERAHQAIFTIQSLTAIADAAEKRIVNGVMPDKAIQLMADVYADSVADHVSLITADHVNKIVTKKTGIPTGPIQESEKEVLLNLEDVLHKRVIGQNAAISSIAKTMRRARAGVQDPNRPIGSFLFLGPTGVGKTETAKALAAVFFKDESAMSRIDMTEYSDETALQRLIGDGEHSGKLSNLLQERPYGVLLLDEFEKASKSVHDLFLQILDEGVFTDGRSSQVNARNAIIIATSNAGSALIVQTMHSRQSVSVLDAEIIHHIISTGIFKPELINRFDSTIIFEPLEEYEQASIAQLMLNALKQRILKRGYVLKITNKLLQALVEKGYSREFGARPLRRLLQDLVEEKVAYKIISGSVKKGETIVLDITDFTNEELGVTGN